MGKVIATLAWVFGLCLAGATGPYIVNIIGCLIFLSANLWMWQNAGINKGLNANRATYINNNQIERIGKKSTTPRLKTEGLEKAPKLTSLSASRTTLDRK